MAVSVRKRVKKCRDKKRKAGLKSVPDTFISKEAHDILCGYRDSGMTTGQVIEVALKRLGPLKKKN